jgi:hypothetical protein
MLLKEFFSGNISEQRENDILQEVDSLVPDPYFGTIYSIQTSLGMKILISTMKEL